MVHTPYHIIPYRISPFHLPTQPKGNDNDLPNSDPRRRHRRVDDRTDVDPWLSLTLTRITIHDATASLNRHKKMLCVSAFSHDVPRLFHVCSK